MTKIIDHILASSITLVLGRSVLSSIFLLAGIAGLADFGLVHGEMQAAGLPNPAVIAVAVIATQLIGSVLLITNIRGLAWLGAGMLSVFLLLSIPLGHPFWKFSEPQRTTEFYIVLEHIALVGGMALAAIASRRRA